MRPQVSLLATGSFRSGWWWLEIDRDGRIAASHRTQERLTPIQERKLAGLIAALPVGKTKYAFGKAYVDASTSFILKVGVGPGAREYEVTDTLGPDAKKLEAQKIVAVVRFLYGVLDSPDAIAPP